MADKSTTLYILNAASTIITGQPRLDELSQDPHKQKYLLFVTDTINSFANIPYISTIIGYYQLKGVQEIINGFPLSSIQDCINLYDREEKSRKVQATNPVQEALSIPPELEALVAEYEEFLATQNENDGKVSSVAESVKRAREAMIIRERLAAIRRNRESLKEGADNKATFNANEEELIQNLLVGIVNPKAKDEPTLLAPTTQVITQAVNSYIDQYVADNNLTTEQEANLRSYTDAIIDSTKYLALTEAIDIGNHHDLVTAISIATYTSSDKKFTSPVSDIYTKLEENEALHTQFNEEIASHQLELSQLNTRLTKEKETKSLTEEIAAKKLEIAKNISDRDSITLDTKPFEDKVESYLSSTTPTVISKIKKSDGSLNRDFASEVDLARKNLDLVHNKLSSSGIQPRIPPPPDPLRQAEKVEKGMRSELPQIGISLHATFRGTQAAALISDPRTQSPNLSGQAILLYSKGLTTRDFDLVIAYAAAHPKSALGILYNTDPILFGTIRQQLDSIEQTNTPEAHIDRVNTLIRNNKAPKALTHLSRHTEAYNEYLELSKKLSPHQILQYAKAESINTNSRSALGQYYRENIRLFKKIASEFTKIKNSSLANEIAKPIGRLGNARNQFVNRVYSYTTKISGFFSRNQTLIGNILNPVGALRHYLGRQASQYIMKQLISYIGNAAFRQGAEKIAETVISLGVKGAIQKLAESAAAKLAAKRAAAEAAKLAIKTGAKVGLEAAVQAASAIPAFGPLIAIGLTIAIEIIFAVIDFTKKALNWISRNFYNEDFNAKSVIRNIAIGTGAVIGGITSGTVAVIVAISTFASVAASSALSIIIASAFLGYFFYISSLLIGPIVSSLAQLEAMPSAPRASGDCIFPVHGKYPICNGPLGSTHSLYQLQAVDFCQTTTAEIHAIANGVVTFAGNNGRSYGNFVIISTNASVGTFDALYAHMSEIGVDKGDQVTQDDVIGITGGTGWGSATYWSDHLHLEYRGIDYNQCPAGGIIIPDGCADFIACGSNTSD